MCGDAEDVDSSGMDLHYEQDVEAAEADGVEVEEIGSQQAGCVGAQEGTPVGVGLSGCGPDAGGGEDGADGARTDVVAKPGEFSLNAAISQRGFSRASRMTNVPSLSSTAGRPGRFG
jgi:hypothetical protein